LTAQGIVLYLARRTDRQRSDPELLKQCAKFSSAAGRFKRDIATKPREEWDLSSLDDLEDASDAIDIIGTSVSYRRCCLPSATTPTKRQGGREAGNV
jgi:hypothetical protein